MNIMTVLVVILFVLFIMLGLKRGLIKSVVKLVIMSAALFIAYILTPFVSGFISDRTGIKDSISNKTYEAIRRVAETRVIESLGGDAQNIDSKVIDEITDVTLAVEPARNQQVDIIRGMNLPEFMTNAIIANNNDDMRKKLGVDNFYKYLAGYISHMIINALAFVISFALIFIIANIIYFAAGIVSRLPIIGGIDRIGGAALGFFEALLVTWLLFIAISIISNLQIGENLVKQINGSGLLKFIYDKNIFTPLIERIFR